MSPCHNLEPSLVARDSSRLLSVKPNEWMHLSPFYTRMHGEWLRYAKSTSQFHWRFLLVRDVRGFQVNPLCRHDITSPFPPSGNGGYVRNLDVLSTFNTTTEMRPFEQDNKPPTAPRAPQHKRLPTSPGVCSLLCVCVHLDGLNAEHKFRIWVSILGHTSLHYLIFVYINVNICPKPLLILNVKVAKSCVTFKYDVAPIHV